MKLDPEARAFLEQLYALGALPYSEMTPAAARSARLSRPKSLALPEHRSVEYEVRVEDRVLRIVRFDARPASQEPGPAILYLHGGGWVLGAVEADDPLCIRLAALTGCSVFAVDYRLAPEHPFPAAVHDSRAALAWLSEEGTALGVDVDGIALFGVSAGGNLASVVARDAVPRVAAQVLFYPPLDARRGSRSYEETWPRMILDTAAMDWFYGHYLPAGQSLDDPDVSPLCGELSQCPATLMMVAGHDPLRDECLEYVAALGRAGVDVTCRQFPELMHGFLGGLGAIEAARETLEDAAQWLRTRLTGSGAIS